MMKILFTGGGTGGHVFPAIAIAEAVQSIEPNAKIIFVGTKEKLEARMIPSHGYEFHTIWISGFRRKISIQNLLFPIKVIVSLIQSCNILKTIQPDAVVGTGGYVCGPVLYAASKKHIPTIVQEQNSYPGVTTRLLANRVDQIHLTFDRSKQYVKNAKQLFVSGNPVRSNMIRIDVSDARRQFGLDPGKQTVFVFGGSLGASAINNAMLAAMPRMVENDIQVIWQTGKNDFAMIQSATSIYASSIIVRSFIDEMNVAYSASDLVICRAGATSLAEITLLGLPSILIPYPYAAANHQYENAKTLSELGAARLLPEIQISEIGQIVLSLMKNKSELQSMAARARTLGKPDAAITIAHSVLDLVHTYHEGKNT